MQGALGVCGARVWPCLAAWHAGSMEVSPAAVLWVSSLSATWVISDLWLQCADPGQGVRPAVASPLPVPVELPGTDRGHPWSYTRTGRGHPWSYTWDRPGSPVELHPGQARTDWGHRGVTLGTGRGHPWSYTRDRPRPALCLDGSCRELLSCLCSGFLKSDLCAYFRLC